MTLRVRVDHQIDKLASDMGRIPVRAEVGFVRALRRSAERGNRAGRRIAARSAGKHGKHYPNSWSAEAISPLVWEYGPDSSEPQGGMSFNEGSRNQPPHHDLEKSLDIERPRFHRDIDRVVDGLFW